MPIWKHVLENLIALVSLLLARTSTGALAGSRPALYAGLAMPYVLIAAGLALDLCLDSPATLAPRRRRLDEAGAKQALAPDLLNP